LANGHESCIDDAADTPTFDSFEPKPFARCMRFGAIHQKEPLGCSPAEWLVLFELDPDWSVIARFVAAADVFVDGGRLQTRRRRRAQQQMVDA
jgi:hypothetical protein